MKIVFGLFLVLLVGLEVAAQDALSKVLDGEWARYESPRKDLSIAFPSAGTIVDNGDGSYRLTYDTGAVILSVEMTPKSDGKEAIERYAGTSKAGAGSKFIKVGDFLIYQSMQEDAAKDYYSAWFWLASSKCSYTIYARTDLKSKPLYTRFVVSTQLFGKPLFVTDDKSTVETVVKPVTSLKTDDLVVVALHRPNSDQPKPIAGNGANVPAAPSPGTYSRGLIVLRKPRGNYTDNARERHIQGTVKLRVTFRADGTIGPIFLDGSLSKDLDVSAFEAARKIKFLPAQIDGKNVEVVRAFEYNFSLY